MKTGFYLIILFLLAVSLKSHLHVRCLKGDRNE